MDIKDLKRLSGLNEGSDYDPNIELDKISSQILHLPEEIINHATNLSSEAEMNDVLGYFVKQLEKVIAKIRPDAPPPNSERDLEKSWGKGVDRMAGSFDDEEIIRQQQRGW